MSEGPSGEGPSSEGKTVAHPRAEGSSGEGKPLAHPRAEGSSGEGKPLAHPRAEGSSGEGKPLAHPRAEGSSGEGKPLAHPHAEGSAKPSPRGRSPRPEKPHAEQGSEPAQAAERDAPEPPRGPGATLRQARRAAGLDVADVAEMLNLRDAVVQAIEEDRFDDLPARTFARGYVRSYASLLNVDSNDAVASFERAAPTNSAPVRPPIPGTVPSLREIPVRRPAIIFGGVVVLIVLTAAGVLAAFWPGGSPWEAWRGNKPEVPSAQTAVASPAPADVRAAGGDAAEVAIGALAGDDLHQLDLRFSENCWVEVRDGNGRTVHLGLEAAGSSLSLRGVAPFHVVLGNATGTELAFDGDVVVLDERRDGDVARLVIGS